MPGITYFLIISVEEYNDPAGFSKVAYAKNDAREVIQAFLNLGYSSEDIIHLQDKNATKTAIETNIELIVRKTLQDDRIVIYLSGHGLSVANKNMFVPADVVSGFIEKSCVSISHILGLLKKARSKRNIIFLDCCHSGFEPGELERRGVQAFDNDQLMMEYRKEEYCIGFASCQSHQLSISDHSLQQGVWSYFLVQALKGQAAAKVYREGCLFSDNLQEYLRDKTSEFVKLNSKPKRDQTPVQFGYATKKFIVEDLSKLFERQSISKSAKDIEVSAISLVHHFSDSIKRHPGFLKGKHFVPTSISTVHDNYVRKISSGIIDADMSEMSQLIRKTFGYKFNQIKVERSDGSGAIITPDFNYLIEIRQNKQVAEEYTITKFAENFNDVTIMESDEIDEIFQNTFNELSFYLTNPLDIEELIQQVEEQESDLLTVSYDHNDLTYCTLKIKGIENEIIVWPEQISITSTYKNTPRELINSFRETNQIFLSRKLPLLLK